MIKAINYLILVVAIVSCNSNKEFRTEDGSYVAKNAQNAPTKKIREEYWPLENETTSLDTVINSNDSFRIKLNTRSLNDSAALYKAKDENGEILIHAHNRITEVTIIRNGSLFVNATLTRNLFKGRDELDELRLDYRTRFLREEENKYIFLVSACVPDSDVCDAAEVAIDDKGVVKVVKFIEEESIEEE